MFKGTYTQTNLKHIFIHSMPIVNKYTQNYSIFKKMSVSLSLSFSLSLSLYIYIYTYAKFLIPYPIHAP